MRSEFRGAKVCKPCTDVCHQFPEERFVRIFSFRADNGLQDKRKAKKDIVDKYPHVNFDRIANELYWNSKENESYESLKERVEFAKSWIRMRKENKIAIVSHSSYLAEFLNGEIIDKNDQLKHCYPYEHNLS